MRKRPLPITIVGWLLLAISSLALLQRIVAGMPNSAGGDGDRFALNWTLETLVFVLLAAFSTSVLKGRVWARSGLMITLAADLVRTLTLEGFESPYVLPVELVLDLIIAAVLYQPRSHDFFHGEGEVPPLTHQMGTALCYGVMTLFLVSTISLPAGFALLSFPTGYKYLLFSMVPVIAYGIGNALGVVVNPKRDIGTMLLIAAPLSFIFCVSLYFRRAGGIDVALRNGDSEPNVNLWVSSVVTTGTVALGLYLIRRSREALDYR